MHGVRLEFRLADGLVGTCPSHDLRASGSARSKAPRYRGLPKRHCAVGLIGPLLEAVDEVEGDHGARIQILYVLGLAPRARKAGKALAPIDAAVVVITRARAVAETFIG